MRQRFCPYCQEKHEILTDGRCARFGLMVGFRNKPPKAIRKRIENDLPSPGTVVDRDKSTMDIIDNQVAEVFHNKGF